jgi:hypothetical protein
VAFWGSTWWHRAKRLRGAEREVEGRKDGGAEGGGQRRGGEERRGVRVTKSVRRRTSGGGWRRITRIFRGSVSAVCSWMRCWRFNQMRSYAEHASRTCEG